VNGRPSIGESAVSACGTRQSPRAITLPTGTERLVAVVTFTKWRDRWTEASPDRLAHFDKEWSALEYRVTELRVRVKADMIWM